MTSGVVAFRGVTLNVGRSQTEFLVIGRRGVKLFSASNNAQKSFSASEKGGLTGEDVLCALATCHVFNSSVEQQQLQEENSPV